MQVALPNGFLRLPIAHRALHNRAMGRIENSPSAVTAAIEAGYAIEIDVQLSRDGVAMVFHDEELGRLTGETGLVSTRTAAELVQIPLTGGQDCIPTLAEILRLIAGRVPLLIEIKDQTGEMGPSDGRLEGAVAADLAGYAGPVAVMSFNPHSVAHMAWLWPSIPRGITTSAYDPDDWAPLPKNICDHLRDIPDYDRTMSSFKSPAAEAEARRIAQNVTFEQYLAKIPASA
jgi:glycerophosphoryl diester phosphodiesterase